MFSNLLEFFIASAHADAAVAPAATQAQEGGIISFLPMFVIFILFIYFAMWRPQNKRAKEQRNLMDSISKGDEVMTAGGMLGKVSKLTEQYVALTIANNVEIMLQKTAIVTVLPKGTLKAIE